eukprot:15439068-Alexandrium_andersonii.AAC.1
MAWHPNIKQRGVQESFITLFGCHTPAPGDIKARAPQEVVEEYIKDQATRQGFPPYRRNKKPWSAYQVLHSGYKERVDGYEKDLAAAGFNPKARLISNIAQKPSYMKGGHAMVPALLRGSILWLHGKSRMMLPIEHLEVMGYNIFGPTSSLTTCFHKEFLRSMDPTTLRKLAGNGMQLRQVGAVMMYIFGCTVPAVLVD